MSEQNYSHEHDYVASLNMVLIIKDTAIGIPYLRDFGSHHVIFWEYMMFSSLSGFHISKTESPYFTERGIPLFLEDIQTPIEVLSPTLEESSLPTEASFLDTPTGLDRASPQLADLSNSSHTPLASSVGV